MAEQRDVWAGIPAEQRASLERTLEAFEGYYEYWEDGSPIVAYGAGIMTQGCGLDWEELPKDLKREALERIDWEGLPADRVAAIIAEEVARASSEREIASLEDRAKLIEERVENNHRMALEATDIDEAARRLDRVEMLALQGNPHLLPGEEPFNSVPRQKSDYERALDEAAKRGSNRSQERGGPER